MIALSILRDALSTWGLFVVCLVVHDRYSWWRWKRKVRAMVEAERGR